jgi:hypothetical protein
MLAVEVQPVTSVTVTVYVPGHMFEMVWAVFAGVVLQMYEYCVPPLPVALNLPIHGVPHLGIVRFVVVANILVVLPCTWAVAVLVQPLASVTVTVYKP